MGSEAAGPRPTGGTSRAGAGGPRLVVSVHDVGPSTAEASRRWTELLAPLGVRVTLLVIPGPWRGAGLHAPSPAGRELVHWLRGRQELGDEIALHGWSHRADVPGSPRRRLTGRLLAGDAAEYWALDRASAARRTAAGLEVLAGHGLTVWGTTPPGWLASSAAVRGIADCALAYTTDHRGVLDLRTGRRWAAPAVCHRPAVGRAGGGRSLEWVGSWVVAGSPAIVAAGRSVRIGLHPADLDRPGLAVAAVTAIRRCLAAGAASTTYAEVVGFAVGATPTG